MIQAKSLFGPPKTAVKEATFVVLPPERQQLTAPVQNQSLTLVDQIVQQNDLTVIAGTDVVMFGSERQKEIGAKLDEILMEITKGNSPVLFELFKQLKKGVEEANLPELEQQIRAAQELHGKGIKGAIFGMLDAIGASSVVARLQKAQAAVDSALTSKSKSLVDLTKQMEAQLNPEVQQLISNALKLGKLADEYRKNVLVFETYVQAGKSILKNGKEEAERRKAKAVASGNPLDTEEANIFQQKVDLFENRLLVLETILTKAPCELQSIYLSQGAGLQILGETASASMEEFNSIKSTLIKLAVTHQQSSLQTLNAQRRQLRDSLEKHGTEALGKVAVDAAKAQGENRLKDATQLLENATKLREISNNVLKEQENNKARFAEARQKLQATREMFTVK